MNVSPVSQHMLTLVPIRSGRGRMYAIRSIPGSPRPHFLFASKEPIRRYDRRQAVGVLTCNPDRSLFCLEYPGKTFLGRGLSGASLGDAYRLVEKNERHQLGNWPAVTEAVRLLTSTGKEIPLV